MPDQRTLPEHVTMPLLDLVVHQALEDEYSQAARRTRERSGPRPLGPSVAAVLVAGLGGMLAITAFVQTTRDAVATESGREALIARVQENRDSLARQQARQGELSRSNQDLEAQVQDASDELDVALTEVERLRVRTGFAAVTGPGVHIEVTDGTSEPVRDEDLAILVDGLWNAGAEAIAINGHRLTVLSAIRNSGAAINVNSVPLRPPYQIDAIGDPKTLAAQLLENTHGIAWYDLVENYGFGYSIGTQDRLRLPAAAPRTLRYAREVGS